MAVMNLAQEVTKRFGANVDVQQPLSRRIWVTTDGPTAVAVNRFLYEELAGRFAIASGVDTRTGMEVLYHFCFDSLNCVVTVRAKLKKPFPEIESIATFLPGAMWIEREIHDILGVTFLNHPDMRRLSLADDWPDGVHPLRRDFQYEDNHSGGAIPPAPRRA